EAMRALHEVSLDIVAQLDLADFLHTLLRRAAPLVQAEAAALAIQDEASGTIRTLATYNTWRDWTGTVFQPGEGLIGKVSETGEALIIDNYYTWPQASGRIKTRHPVMMCVPLRWRERVIGALLVLNGPSAHVFTSEDQRLLI